MTRRHLSSVSLVGLLLSQCTGPTKPDPTVDAPPAASEQNGVVIPPPPQTAPVAEAKATYYRQAFPTATRFEGKRIPPDMVRSLDQGNDTYVEAYGADGALLGYLRDINAPVSLSAACECHPLNLSLVFGSDQTLTNIISAAPITKHGHVPMTPEDVQRLVELARQPPPELRKVLQPEDLLDGETGATQTEHQPHVVAMAALTTHRVAGLVRDTLRILKGAPVSWDQRRLQQVLEEAGNDHARRAQALAGLLPTVETPAVAREVLHFMGRSYLLALEQGTKPSSAVEARLIKGGLSPEVDAHEAMETCYALASRKLRLELAEKCANTYENSAHVPPALVQRLIGTIRYQSGQTSKAVAPLREAAAQIDAVADPQLHVRLAQSLAAAGDGAGACTAAKSVFMQHPRLPAAAELLRNCPDAAAVEQATYEALRQRLLERRRPAGEAAPVLPLETLDNKPLDLELHDPARVTVAVFFATWCPHCRAEMPAIVSFAHEVAKGPLAEKVRVLGVRTAVEKEVEPYAAFVKTFAPPFPVYVDPVMALAFSKFAKSQGLPAGIPVLAVIDTQGQVRHVLESGDYRDTARELKWAVEDVLDGAQ